MQVYIEQLDQWRKYTKDIGRNYPVDWILFSNWIKLNFNNDRKPDYTSPYELRTDLINQKLDFTHEENRHKLGRALYHIAQTITAEYLGNYKLKYNFESNLQPCRKYVL